jgi:hypothetical protein
MSGDTLSGWSVGYAFAGVTAGAWWITGRERGALAVTGATVITQFLLHALFTLSQLLPGTDPAAASGMTGMATTSMHATAVAHAAHTWSPRMVLAHLLAALVCALWMWRGEAAVFRLGRALTAFVAEPLRLACALARALAAPSSHGPVRVRAVFGPVRRLRRPALRYAVTRRGPPAGLYCC